MSRKAQYFRDPKNMETYLEANHFLASINNEAPEARNQTYAHNLASLNHLVLVLFTEDKTVIPKESSWFGSEADIPSDDSAAQRPLSLADRVVIPMHLQPLYKEDWIGLRKLDEKGGVVFDSCVGEHMQMGDCWERLVRQYVGGLYHS